MREGIRQKIIHTHTYMYMCVCVCVYIYIYIYIYIGWFGRWAKELIMALHKSLSEQRSCVCLLRCFGLLRELLQNREMKMGHLFFVHSIWFYLQLQQVTLLIHSLKQAIIINPIIFLNPYRTHKTQQFI